MVDHKGEDMTLNEYAVEAGTKAGDLNCAAAGRLEWTQEDARVAVDEYNRTMETSRVIEGAARRLGGDLKPAWDKIQEAR
jgi:hypothetical protein